MIKIAIAGYKGRMGRMLVEELESGAWPDLSFYGGTSSSDNAGTLFDADMVIDFTAPEATRKHICLAAKRRIPIVIGTTGLTDGDMEEMQSASAETPILYSANMSVGVNLLAALVEQAAARLGGEFDIGISEIHHRNKKDAPSGTALMLGRAAAPSSPSPFRERAGVRAKLDSKRGVVPPHPNPLPEGEGVNISYAVQRGGDVVGDHTVSFFGPGERIELTHRAHDRKIYAKGALRAALWLKGKPPGFYTMRDVLDL
jgi:4-hydroxy-tetrahydrodipicolinate reductase